MVKLNKERGAFSSMASLPSFPFCTWRLRVSFVLREGAGVQRINSLSFLWSQGLCGYRKSEKVNAGGQIIGLADD